MPIYYLILVIIVIFLVISLLLNLLSSPITWVIIGVLFVYSMIRRYFYQKELDKYNAEWTKKNEEKKKATQAREDYNRGSDDVIDVDYKEYDDENK